MFTCVHVRRAVGTKWLRDGGASTRRPPRTAERGRARPKRRTLCPRGAVSPHHIQSYRECYSVRFVCALPRTFLPRNGDVVLREVRQNAKSERFVSFRHAALARRRLVLLSRSLLSSSVFLSPPKFSIFLRAIVKFAAVGRRWTAHILVPFASTKERRRQDSKVVREEGGNAGGTTARGDDRRPHSPSALRCHRSMCEKCASPRDRNGSVTC